MRYSVFFSGSIVSLLLLAGCAAGGGQGAGVTRLDGSSASLDALMSGRAAVVNFWAADCPFCVDELPLFEEVYRNHPDIAVVGVNLQEPPRIAREYWREGGYTFPSLLDPQATLKRRFDVFTRPTTVFLNAQGEVVSKKNGPITEGELERNVEGLVEQ